MSVDKKGRKKFVFIGYMLVFMEILRGVDL